MTDQMPADDVTDDDRDLAREWAASIESNTNFWGDRVRAAARMILNTVPAPPRPTLADMTEEERRECQWMQADVENHRVGYVIVNPCDEDGDAELVSAEGRTEWLPPDMVTPRPDLPRLQWPAEAPVPPNTLSEGSAWDDADALERACKESGRDQIIVADCDGDVTTWGSRSDWWETGIPAYGFDPYTIVHIGKKADQ